MKNGTGRTAGVLAWLKTRSCWRLSQLSAPDGPQRRLLTAVTERTSVADHIPGGAVRMRQ